MSGKPLAPGHLRTTISYLEMRQPLDRRPPPSRPGVTVMEAQRCPVSFYRFLYHTVGEDWLWEMRRRMPDAELARAIGTSGVSIHVLYVDGVPAGYAELNRSRLLTVDLSYFGLMPGYIGRGLGPWLLHWAVAEAWQDPSVQRMTVNTCTMDHPKAMALYLSAGFQSLRTQDRDLPDPRLSGVIPRHAAPHIPLAEPAP